MTLMHVQGYWRQAGWRGDERGARGVTDSPVGSQVSRHSRARHVVAPTLEHDLQGLHHINPIARIVSPGQPAHCMIRSPLNLSCSSNLYKAQPLETYRINQILEIHISTASPSPASMCVHRNPPALMIACMVCDAGDIHATLT
jgi:hypothetical protein